MTTTETTYAEVPNTDVPENLIWVTPRQSQGQITEVSYSTGVPSGRSANYDADKGDPWKRVIDHQGGRPRFYRLAKS